MGISLVKGQKISLEKSAGSCLNKVVMGLGWDATDEQDIDLDASCILFDEHKNMLDAIWFAQLKSNDGSIIHTGDNLTGEGEGDDEQIIVDLTRVPSKVKTIMFVVNSFSGEDFSEIENAFCRIVNHADDKEIGRYNLSCQGDHTAMIMAKLYRHNDEWKMHAIGENCDGETFEDLLPAMQSFL